MKTPVAAVVVAVGMFLTATMAHAEAFIGVGISSNSYNYDDLDNSTGNKIFGGYYARNGVFGEVARIDLGDTESDLGPVGLEVSGVAAYLGYRGAAGPTGLGGFGKVGAYSFDSDLLSGGSSVATESSSGLAWGLGVYYAFSKRFTIRGELEQFVNVEDFATDESITGGSLSVEFRF